jgi:hypothetical protein
MVFPFLPKKSKLPELTDFLISLKVYDSFGSCHLGVNAEATYQLDGTLRMCVVEFGFE